MRASIRYALLVAVLAVSPLSHGQAENGKDEIQVAQRSGTSRGVISAPGRKTLRRVAIPEPFAHYKLDGDARDSSGNGFHGFNAEAKPAQGRFGRLDTALAFDGVNDFLSLPININPGNLPQLTMTAWVKPDNPEGYTFVLNHDSGGFDRSISVNTRGNTRLWSAYGGNTARRVTIQADAAEGAWIFVAAVYNQETGLVRFHLNDLVREANGKVGQGYEQVRAGVNIIGMNFFRGAMDDIRFYNEALPAAEVMQIYEEAEAEE